MRSLRLFLYFLVGFGLSAVSLLSFAQLHEWTGSRTSPGSIYTRGPNGLPFNVDTGRYVGVGSASDGGASLTGRYSGSLAGRSLAIQSAQNVSGSALANLGKGLARIGGPAALALTLAPLIWDEIQEDWLEPKEGLIEGDAISANWVWKHQSGANTDPRDFGSALDACKLGSARTDIYTKNPLYGNYGGQSLVSRYDCWVKANTPPSYASTDDWLGSTAHRAASCPSGSIYSPSTAKCVFFTSCPSGQLREPDTGQCSDGYQRASDQALEDAIYVELVSRGMGSDLARRLISSGYEPQVIGAASPIELSGPSSLQGGTTTSTTSGPSGQTTTNTTTNFDISYDGDTVTVTETTTSTTTRPDGQTETTTETKTPAPGHSDGGDKEAKEEQKPFCELYPQASACQELGESSDEDLGEEERSFGWDLPNDVSAQCPEPRVFTSVTVGQSWDLEWGPVCEAAEAVKPVVIAFGLLSAAVFVFGIARARA